jgi:hypothetical protein
MSYAIVAADKKTCIGKRERREVKESTGCVEGAATNGKLGAVVAGSAAIAATDAAASVVER